jgi:hypothetical protein
MAVGGAARGFEARMPLSIMTEIFLAIVGTFAVEHGMDIGFPFTYLIGTSIKSAVCCWTFLCGIESSSPFMVTASLSLPGRFWLT